MDIECCICKKVHIFDPVSVKLEVAQQCYIFLLCECGNRLYVDLILYATKVAKRPYLWTSPSLPFLILPEVKKDEAVN